MRQGKTEGKLKRLLGKGLISVFSRWWLPGMKVCDAQVCRSAGVRNVQGPLVL